MTAPAAPTATPAGGTALPVVLVADPVSEDGLSLLRPHTRVEVRAGVAADGFRDVLAEAEALLVRSETRVTAELLAAAPRLRVIGRAGAGVDTIDVQAATERGIVVVNAPGGNAVAAAEHTVGLLFAMARHIAAADGSMKRGEWKRSSFVGQELTGKTLGLVGFGRVGGEVARRAHGLDMRVLVYDPYVPADHMRRLGYEPADLDELLPEADFVSLHVPLTEATRGLMNAERLGRMKRGAFLVNCARGDLMEPSAVIAALDSGHLAGAAVDVYVKEPVSPEDPLPHHPKVIATPHLGASTVEAQTAVAVQIAQEVLAVLNGYPAQFAVNAPNMRADEARAVQPFLELATLLGKLATQLADGHLEKADITYRGTIAEHDVSAVTAAAIKGLIQPISDVPVTLVNARLLAQARGLDISETRSATPERYTGLIWVTLHTDQGETHVAGTVSDGLPYVVQINDFELHLPPTAGYLLVTRHRDQPGIIGHVGTLLGEADINISSMQVGREAPRGQALMLLSVDEPVSQELALRIRSAANVDYLKVIKL